MEYIAHRSRCFFNYQSFLFLHLQTDIIIQKCLPLENITAARK